MVQFQLLQDIFEFEEAQRVILGDISETHQLLPHLLVHLALIIRELLLQLLQSDLPTVVLIHPVEALLNFDLIQEFSSVHRRPDELQVTDFLIAVGVDVVEDLVQLLVANFVVGIGEALADFLQCQYSVALLIQNVVHVVQPSFVLL